MLIDGSKNLHVGGEISENPQASPSIGDELWWLRLKRRLAVEDTNLVWWIQMGGTCCFLVGVVCLLVAHILGRP